MARNIFRPEGLIYRILNFLTDLFFLSLLFAVCCIPVITIGSAAAALYDSVSHCVRGKEEGPYRRFFRTFGSGFGKMCLTTVLWLAVILFGLWMLDNLAVMAETSQFFRAFYMFYYVLMLIPAGAACWAVALQSRFTLPFGKLNLQALRCAVAFLPRTVILVLLTLAAMECCIRYLFPIAFVPALMMLGWTLFVEPAFARFPSDPEGQEQQGEDPGQE